MRVSIVLCLLIMVTACETTDRSVRRARQSDLLAQAQDRAEKYQSRISIPDFESTPVELTAAMEMAILNADDALDAIAKVPPASVAFENTVRALDDAMHDANSVANRIYLIKETSQDPAMRQQGIELIKRFQDWAVGLDYREEVYASIKSFADTNPDLEGEDQRLLEETLKDYKRAGLQLPKPQRDDVEELRKTLSSLSTDFDSNITEAQHALKFSKADLEGVPESFLNLESVKTGDDEYTVMANVTWHFLTVMENAKRESTRKEVKTARYSLAHEKNVELLNRIIQLRITIARKLGYGSWADLRIEPKMAKDGQTATQFLKDLKDGLQPKFEAELGACRELKVRDTGDPNAEIHHWDWRYYQNQLKKEKYAVDAEQLRDYFPYEQTLEGMFAIYERIFGLTIDQAIAPSKWVDDLELHVVSDAKTGEPLGTFYLDMFPREGKYNHFAQFPLIKGKRLPSGIYQRPCVALICNFPSPTADKPSLLSHSEVETLFHEFGHALHSILTRAEHSRFSGTSVPRDFVEAPSQMLENWIWDKEVLDTFAAHYQDSNKKIPEDIIHQLREARLATIGTFYRRQLSFGLMDLEMHSETDPEVVPDALAIANQTFDEVFLSAPEGTAFVAYFGHLTGYDAGYYGYAWADAISADMATVFESAPNRYFDEEIGMRLRNEIYAPGDSRDVNESIREFLGRERSIDPFLKSIGIEP